MCDEPEYPKDLNDAVWDLIFKRDEEIKESLQYHEEMDLEFWQQADNHNPMMVFTTLMHERESLKKGIEQKND